MTCDLLLAVCLTIHGPGVISYTPILERVAERRVLNEWGLSADWREYDILVAPADCGLLGRSGWLITSEGIQSALVVDCAQEKHRQPMIDNGLLVDANMENLTHLKGWLVLK